MTDTPLQSVGTALSVFGTAITVAGAVLNAIGGEWLHLAFSLWMISNSMFLVYFLGVYYKKWIVNSDARFLILMYAWFIATSTYGFLGSA